MRFHGKTDLPFEPYFVVGAQRTGTTVLHALICTDDATNDFIAESNYYTELLTPFMSGWAQFDSKTKEFFPERQRYIDYHGHLMRAVLHDIWVQLGQPKKLVLKDPILSLHMHILAQLVPETKFVISIRDPRDVVASRVVVHQKAKPNVPVGERDITRFCGDFNSSYMALVKMPGTFAGRALLVPYEGLARTGDLSSVEQFVGVTCRKDKVWKSELTDINTSKSEWQTEQYGKPLNADSIGNYAKTLSEDQVRLVLAQCGPLMQQLGMPLT